MGAMRLTDTIPRFAPQERDIDLLLLEELHCEPAFAQWLAAEADLGPVVFVDAWHSVYKGNGETDILVVFDAVPGRLALMIEDKVGAPMQPDQAARYRSRGQEMIARGEALAVSTLLLAPQAYLDSVPAGDWDRHLSFERLSSWFAARQGPRATWRRVTLDAASDRVRRARRLDAVGARSGADAQAILSFKADYLAALRVNHPSFKANPSTGLVAEYLFTTKVAPTFVHFWHHIGRGELDLAFDGRWNDKARAALRGRLPFGTRLVEHRTATHVVFSVEPMDVSAPFQDQFALFEAMMAEAERSLPLIDLVVSHP